MLVVRTYISHAISFVSLKMSATVPKAAAKKGKAKPKEHEHPKYGEMIAAAIASLKERSGSSRQAILKYVQANYKVGDTCNNHLKVAIKRGVASGALDQVKGTGASGSFKLPKKAAAKKPKSKKSVKKPAGKKAAAKKSPKKKPAAKKPAAKKPAAKKSAAKKPTAKKPAAKKPAAKKPAVKKGKK